MSRSTELLQAAMASDTDDCIEWPMGKDKCGYGRVKPLNGEVLVHRIVCRTAYGNPTPEKPNALHSCGNRACMNPKHLRWGNQKENRQDMLKDGTMPVGEANGASRLTTADVIKIRSLSAKGKTQRAIAKTMNCGVASVCDIVNRKRWKHV